TEAQHLDIVERKTAFMFSVCSEIGGIVAGANREQRRALAHYGKSVGVAFQLVDDMLDFVSTEAKLGKPVANDLREGKLTLPLIDEHGTLERARRAAHHYANEAIESLDVFPHSTYRQALMSVPRFIVEREM